MGTPSHESREFARRAIEIEASGLHESQALQDAAISALSRFQAQMAHLVGRDGFALLARRALDSSRAEYAFLREIEMPADVVTGMDGLAAALRERDPDEARTVLESILAHVIDLLFQFLGIAITTRLICNAWPALEGPTGPDRPVEST